MSEASTANMLVYRDGRSRVSAGELVRQLDHALASVESGCQQDAPLNALLRAGELECALRDAESATADAAAALTDELASLAFRADARSRLSRASHQQLLSSIHCHGELNVSRPEGFAYYALHPLDFADLVSQSCLRTPSAYVVGIRSIGTTLSAVVSAKVAASGVPAARTTVRPHGQPYDRRTTFTRRQRDAVVQALSRGALFLVCDEGPGRSGSSLLSVAEALEREGVRPGRILLLCSHEPDVDALCAPEASQRWRRYRTLSCGITKRLPREAGHYVGGGEWRRFLIPEGEVWPAAWPQMERLKFLSHDRHKILKFEGHGPYGEAVRKREQLLAVSGFGARYLGDEVGFGKHELVDGSQLDIARPSESLLKHVARYCAWRSEAFPAQVSQDGMRQLEGAAIHNIAQEFGFAPELHLEVQRPAICDGRMQHYEWRELGDERWIKLDASTHGDDHFFPGATDIAWDLAAIRVEWQLTAGCRDFFLAEYRRMSGDNPADRLQSYEIAYAAFRLGWSRMAAASVSGDDEGRLLRDATAYRAVLDSILATNALCR